MNKVNYDPRKFDVDAYGNLYPKRKLRPFYVKKLRKSPQMSGRKENK